MQQGYPPAQNVVVMPSPMFGESPMQVTCGNCKQVVMSRTVAENGACAYIAAVVMVFVFCPCFWIPLCMDSCKDIHHLCPSCGCRLGSYKKI